MRFIGMQRWLHEVITTFLRRHQVSAWGREREGEKKSFHKVRFSSWYCKNQKPGVNCVKTGQHNKTFLPAAFKPATEVHLSLLLFLQRGPPRFNWVLMESKSPLLLQPPELDMLIPPTSPHLTYKSAAGSPGCVKNSHSVQSGRETRRWVGRRTPPAELGQWYERDTWGETLTWRPLSTRRGKLSRATGCPSTQLALGGLLYPEGPHLHFNRWIHQDLNVYRHEARVQRSRKQLGDVKKQLRDINITNDGVACWIKLKTTPRMMASLYISFGVQREGAALIALLCSSVNAIPETFDLPFTSLSQRRFSTCRCLGTEVTTPPLGCCFLLLIFSRRARSTEIRISAFQKAPDTRSQRRDDKRRDDSRDVCNDFQERSRKKKKKKQHENMAAFMSPRRRSAYIYKVMRWL